MYVCLVHNKSSRAQLCVQYPQAYCVAYGPRQVNYSGLEVQHIKMYQELCAYFQSSNTKFIIKHSGSECRNVSTMCQPYY